MRFKNTFFLWLILICNTAIAQDNEQASIKTIVETVLLGAGFVTKLLWVACVTVGIALIIMSFTFYKAHRFNPKMVPLGKPVMYFVIGVIIAALPFFDKIFTETGDVHVYKKKQAQALKNAIVDIDAPLVEDCGQ